MAKTDLLDKCKDFAEKVIKYYRENAKPRERMGAFIDRIGFEIFSRAVLG
jgi:dissimilatory sulfite reductase (desulfoviridin) alpha/beta subunit